MIELTVIGGYLGSGKTTLLNEVLNRRDGERSAVIVNDFGAVNIDAEILGSRNGRTMEISNGCICCDLSDGMAAAIENIRATSPPVSRVFVEVSGVGQPDILARWGDHPGFSRGGSVVCADVTSVRRNVSRKWVGQTVRAQLLSADRILLTKTDLVDDQTRRDVQDWLVSQLGTAAEIIDRGQVLGGTQLRRPENKSDRAAQTDEESAARSSRTLDVAAASEASMVAPHIADSEHAARTHSSWTITTASAIDPERLRVLVLNLPATVVRAKGILPDSRRPGRWFLIQFDGTRCDTDEVVSQSAAPDTPGRLVIIAAGNHIETPGSVTALAQALQGRISD